MSIFIIYLFLFMLKKMHDPCPNLIPIGNIIPYIYTQLNEEILNQFIIEIPNDINTIDIYEKYFKPLGFRRTEMPLIMMKILSLDYLVGIEKLEYIE